MIIEALSKQGLAGNISEQDLSTLKIADETTGSWRSPTEEELMRLDADISIVKAEVLQEKLMILCDGKQEDAYKLMLGYKATPKQIERYKDKYERAKEGEFEDAVNAVIIQKFEVMRSAIRQFTDMIELFRSYVDDLIQSGELDKAEFAIEAGQQFDAETQTDDVKALFE